MISDADVAKAEAWRIARLLTQGERGLASTVMRAAEMDVMRSLLASALAGGEAEYWRMVARKLEGK
jgi:hypothetical protein